MNKKFKNVCIRCGTERVVLKTWKEKIDNSIVTIREMICPNRKCQIQVNADNKKQDDRRDQMKLRNEQRVSNRKTARRFKKTKNP